MLGPQWALSEDLLVCFPGSSGCEPGPPSFLEGEVGKKGAVRIPGLQTIKRLFGCIGSQVISRGAAGDPAPGETQSCGCREF